MLAEAGWPRALGQGARLAQELLDVPVAPPVQALIERTLAVAGVPDLLVNNASAGAWGLSDRESVV